MVDGNPVTWDTGRWAAIQRAAGRPESTIALRLYHLRRAAAGVGVPVEAVTVDQLAAWLAGQGWSPETRRSYRASLRSFFGWCQAAGIQATRDLRAVQELLGHARPETTARYTRIAPDAIRRCVAASAA